MNKLKLQIPIIASACPIEQTGDLNMLGMIITKSVTLEPRQGYPANYIEYGSGMTWNMQALPSLGIKDFIRLQIPRYKSILDTNIPLVVSIYATGATELSIMLGELDCIKDYIFGIELNLSCPNIEHNIVPHEELMMINYLYDQYKDKFISLKLSPSISDSYLDTLLKYTDVRWINCFNTIPIDRICFGLQGGLGGMPIKDIYVQRIRNIKQMYPEFNVIATGGIESGQDVKDYLDCGASLTGVASYFLKHKSNIRSLVTEYVSYYMDDI